jgi:signal peptidase I
MARTTRTPMRLGMIAMVLVGLLIGRLSFLRGLVVPVRVTGGSMAESLLGDHALVACERCDFPWRFDAELAAGSERLVCPSCGLVDIDRRNARLVRGERVWLDAFPVRVLPPCRWEIMAIQAPDDPPRLAVKRIVGLPGESVAIRDGELFIDGRLQRKPFEHLRSLAVLVHDAAYQPIDESTGKMLPRWISATSDSRWQGRAGEYVRVPPLGEPPEDEPDWLVYRHVRCFAGSPPPGTESPVWDNDGFNPGLSRRLNRVTDLWLACEVQLTGMHGQFAVRYDDPREPIEVRWQLPSGRVELRYLGEFVQGTTMPPVPFTKNVRVDFAIYDRRVVFAIDDRVILEYDGLEEGVRAQPTSRPLGIAVAGLAARIRRPRIYRDVFWLDPHGLNTDWHAAGPLAADQFFVLGDNAPISVDSRHWPSGSVHRKTFIGKVLRCSTTGRRN